MKLARDSSEPYYLGDAPVVGVELDGAADAATLGLKLAYRADVAIDDRNSMIADTQEAKEALHLQQALFATLKTDSNPGPFSLRAVDHTQGLFIPTRAAATLLERVVEGQGYGVIGIARYLVRSALGNNNLDARPQTTNHKGYDLSPFGLQISESSKQPKIKRDSVHYPKYD